MNWIWKRKNSEIDVRREEYVSMVHNMSNMKLQIRELELELALILKKLKFKYKITKRDLAEDDKKDEPEDIYKGMLLPE